MHRVLIVLFFVIHLENTSKTKLLLKAIFCSKWDFIPKKEENIFIKKAYFVHQALKQTNKTKL